MFGPVFRYFILFVLIVSVIGGIYVFKKDGLMGTLFKPVSVVSKVITEKEIKSTDERTNILLLGLDQRSPGSAQGGILTDTIMVLSIGKNGSNTVLVSIPRDLWIEYARPDDPSRVIKGKINSLYYFAGVESDGHVNSQKGKDAVQDEVEQVLGLPIHYYTLVGFNAFRDAIDAVGGVNVDVEHAFVDHEYPIEGKENAMPESSRYMTVKFEQGNQSMNGETALQYARSRHATEYVEAGDFARARRQQRVIVALKDKVLSTDTLFNPSKITELYDAYKKNVETDLSLAELMYFYEVANKLEINNVKKLVLSNEQHSEEHPGSGMLMVPTQEARDQFYGGAYVLVPTGGSFESIKTLVRTYLFCDDTQDQCK